MSAASSGRSRSPPSMWYSFRSICKNQQRCAPPPTRCTRHSAPPASRYSTTIVTPARASSLPMPSCSAFHTAWSWASGASRRGAANTRTGAPPTTRTSRLPPSPISSPPAAGADPARPPPPPPWRRPGLAPVAPPPAGLMQFMPFWPERLGLQRRELVGVEANIRMGCAILRHYLAAEHNDVRRALGRYNGSVSSRNYPDRVVTRWTRFWKGADDLGRG